MRSPYAAHYCVNYHVIEHVTQCIHHHLCRDVHAVCLWDDKGPAKIHQALKEDILDFIKQAQAVRCLLRRQRCLVSLWSQVAVFE